MGRRNVLIAAVLVGIVVVAGAVYFGFILPNNVAPITTGTPAITSQFGDIKTKVKTATATGNAFNANDMVQRVSYVAGRPAQAQTGDGYKFTSCTAARGATATPSVQAVQATAAATAAVATEAAAANPPEPDFIVLSIVGDESEACYQVGEVFFNRNNQFNLAIGVTKAINGEVAIDRANLANSKVGEIAVDISQLASDERQRDGFIRRSNLESNKFPIAKLTNAKIVGLPSRAFVDGELLNFQIIGTLQVRDVQKETIFNVVASLKGDTLTGTATTDLKMTDFGFQPPKLAILEANDDVHLIFNFVAREPATNPEANPTVTP